MNSLDQAWAAYKERAKEVPVLQVAIKAGARLMRSGAKEHVGACPSCNVRDCFSVNTKKNVWHCRAFRSGRFSQWPVCNLTCTYARAHDGCHLKQPKTRHANVTSEQTPPKSYYHLPERVLKALEKLCLRDIRIWWRYVINWNC